MSSKWCGFSRLEEINRSEMNGSTDVHLVSWPLLLGSTGCPVTGKDGALCPAFPSQVPGLQPFETILLSSMSLTVHPALSMTRLWVRTPTSHVV